MRILFENVEAGLKNAIVKKSVTEGKTDQWNRRNVNGKSVTHSFARDTFYKK